MPKITNKVLALQVSERISEILNLTGLTIKGLAKFCNIAESSLRGNHNASVPISLETVSKLCKPFNIIPHCFINFDTEIPSDIASSKKLQQFHEEYINKSLRYFKEEPKVYKANKKKNITRNKNIQLEDITVASGKKRERDILSYLVFQTAYFSKARTVAEIAEDIEFEFKVAIESGRLYQLLTKYVDKELKREASLRVNNDERTSKRQIFKYVKN
ncbi:hypothetical protein [Sphingobacterium sp. LRF_L2]|uniref:hypothetical protein n=1 Tax=Sphingobacterium sp. LRF_L2 TaxID=3369421 RepID=UPI003F6444A9